MNNLEQNPIQKVVRFDENVGIHVMVVWNFAYRNARKRYWENFAIDRLYFARRVHKLEKILGPILIKSHKLQKNKSDLSKKLNI